MRRTLTVLGLPLRLLLLGIVGLYRATLGRVLAGRCRFYPSCSAYAEEALRRHGAAKGSVLAGFRVLRCSPLWDGGPDPVPERGAWRPPQYDSVTRGGE